MNLKIFNLINFSKSSGSGHGNGDLFRFPFTIKSTFKSTNISFTCISNGTTSDLLRYNLELGEEMT